MRKILCVIFTISCLTLNAQHIAVASSDECSIEKCAEKWCLKNVYGEIIVADLDSAYRDTKSHVFFVKKNNAWGIVSLFGKTLIPIQFDKIERLVNLMAETFYIVHKQNKIGLYSNVNGLIIPLQFQSIEILNNEYSVVGVENHKQLYNHKTQTLFAEPKFDKIYWRNAQYSAITYNGKDNLVDNKDNFKIIFPFEYQSISDYGEGNFVVNKEGKYGVVNINNEIKIPFFYSGLYIFCEKVVAEKERKYGILSLDNKELMPFEYRQIIGRSGTLEMYPINSYEYKVYNCDLHCIENCE